ncbi:MAG: hypothetical protein HKL92_09690 [Candidatus Eremiobacteraeota bacterium]|nr:hypothetical protein [Candidatus Eremiobacteraeota bacterium]
MLSDRFILVHFGKKPKNVYTAIDRGIAAFKQKRPADGESAASNGRANLFMCLASVCDARIFEVGPNLGPTSRREDPAAIASPPSFFAAWHYPKSRGNLSLNGCDGRKCVAWKEMNIEISAIFKRHFSIRLNDLFSMRPIVVDQIDPSHRQPADIHEPGNRADITPEVLICSHNWGSGFHRTSASHPFGHFMKKSCWNDHDGIRYFDQQRIAEAPDGSGVWPG